MVDRRVVITGLGLVTPLGLGTEATWSGLVAGRSGIGPISRFDATDYDSRIAGECLDFQAENWIPKKEIKKMDLFMQFGIAAAQMAWDDAGFERTEENAHRLGVMIGSGIGGLSAIQNQAMVLQSRGPGRISPFFIPMSLINLISGHVAIRFGLQGPNHAVVTACATGTHAIGDAARIIRRGEADGMLAGGAEAANCELAVGGFAAAKALSLRNDAPQQASRPWDRDRDGFVIAEGAGVVFLEEMESAKRRGATLYAEVVGYGMSGDAYHITAPEPHGDGAVRCMQAALQDAGVPADVVDYINAHGTSTPQGDAVETEAIKKVLGAEQAKKVMVSSTKSMTGHLLGAAGGVEAIFTALALHHQIIPPTINLDNPDPLCDLDYVPHTARAAAMTYALSNSFGFGGTNASLLLKRSP
ncbi:MAG: beta-ketoacyl-ACP synthase II [Magnetococcales bacterium]|nr:beta-ketoacyl-ACP synthase II [Magnetococcales bacterium]